jgi:hypothetical protein
VRVDRIPDSGVRDAEETTVLIYAVRIRVSAQKGDAVEPRVRAALATCARLVKPEHVTVEEVGVDLIGTQPEDDLTEALRVSVKR